MGESSVEIIAAVMLVGVGLAGLTLKLHHDIGTRLATLASRVGEVEKQVAQVESRLARKEIG